MNMSLLCCAVMNTHPSNVILFIISSLRLYLFLFYSTLGSLQLPFPMDMTFIFEHNMLLPRVIKLYWCHSALVHLSPLCPKYMCSQWPICMYCHNSICHSSDFSVAAFKQDALNQVAGSWTSDYYRKKFWLLCC